ncbi:MAG TPA: AMP-binding protein [Planctomycetota bacterium]|nr:AMP-binding protein [Planctomycetota bacterium]
MSLFHDASDEKLKPDDLRALQAAKLRALLGVVSSNKFYKARFKAAGIKGADFSALTLEQLPFVSKADFAADQAKSPPFGTNLTFPVNEYCRFNHSSGSTGAAPLRWLDTPQSWDWMVRNWSYIFGAAGLKQKDRVCFAFSFGPFLGFWTAFEAAARIGALCLPAGGMSTSARLRFMLDNGITVVCCTPTYAMRMAQTAAEERINIALSPVRMLIVAGEPGGSVPSMRKQIEESWGARCIDHYGMTETGPVSFECEKTPLRMHIIESEYIAECVDFKSGASVADGEPGELVLTNLGRTASPAIRYRTGDVVRVTRKPCACGRSFASLDGGILGRTDDMIIVRGVNLYPSAVEEVIRSFPIVEFRVEVTRVRAMSELRIQFEADPLEDSASLAKKIAAELDKKLGIRVAVESAAAGTLPRFEMKARRWVVMG